MMDIPFDAAMVAAAESMAGVAYTDAERALVAAMMDEQLALPNALRAVEIGNDVPMASVFDPRLPSLVMPDQPDTQVFRAVNPGPLPDNDIDIAFASVAQLSAWLASGSMTSVRLTELYLDRIRTLGPVLRAMLCNGDA